MTQTFTLMPVPKWYIADLVGRPLGSGYLAAFSSENYVSDRNIYMDASLSLPWPRVAIPNQPFTGILFDENGSQGPFYFLFDTDDANNLYYLAVYDEDGVLQWDIDNFNPSGGSGGGNVTTANNSQNQIINSPMWRHTVGTTPVVTTSTQFMLIAPGAHASLSNDIVVRPVTTADYTGPDIVFLKNNTTSTDAISFPLFTPLGANNFGVQAQPPDYFHYECSVPGSSESTKCVQFPILSNVANLSNKSVNIQVWAKSGSSNDLTLNWKQFYGDGGGSATINPTITTFNLTPLWAVYTITATVPDVSGKTLGSCGNSGLFLQVEFPLDVISSIDFTVPRIYLGNSLTPIPSVDFQNYDVIDSMINTPRTGDVKLGMATSAIPGYLIMNDGTISLSAATPPAGHVQTRINADTFPLYNLLWTNVTSQANGTNGGGTGYAQLYNSAGTALAVVGASATADFTAGKQIALTKALGRVLGGSGSGSGLTARALGEYTGTETVSLTLLQMPIHQHGSDSGQPFVTESGASSGGGGSGFGRSPKTDFQGNGDAHPNMQPTTFLNYFIKL